eukprot:TRINITY_DN26692_c0_g1_i1.p2 TRINITY_DN26692_c0_g1~~TRINITY_DN26692_c0_g1_i1.p2  ORF type:complete len:104 (-),score=49.25 TRINITY_DN26692_c0_g1_i1:127-438(-)
MIRRPPRSTQSRSSAASDVYKRQVPACPSRALPSLRVPACPSHAREANPRRVDLRDRALGSSDGFEILAALDVHTCHGVLLVCLLYTSPSPRDRTRSRMPSSA